MNKRRDFLKKSLFAGGLFAMPFISDLQAASARSKATPRFIFLRKSNGTSPGYLVPPSFSSTEKSKETNKEPFVADLDRHELPAWMAPLNSHRKNLTLLQGLSAKMCTMGHVTTQSPLAVCKASERSSTIARASVDVELGRMFPSPFEHIELTVAKNQSGVVRGLSSIGKGQPNYAFASPDAAFENLFTLASSDRKVRMDKELDDDVYRFLSKRSGILAKDIKSNEEIIKIQQYRNAANDLIRRNAKLKAMASEIRKHAPKIKPSVMNGDYNTLEQHEAFCEILLKSAYLGLSNSFTLTLDDLDTRYSGMYDGQINLHDIGHGKGFEGDPAAVVRSKIRTHHMNMVKKLVEGLKKMPEGNGSMFDNTIIMYLPENGEKHHSQGTEVPFVILAGDKVKLDLGRRYIRLPNYNKKGHKTLGNWYTTILNAYGSQIKHFGNLDVALTIDQKGPIKQLMS